MEKVYNKPPSIIADNLDARWAGQTIYNYYEHPREFMEDVIANKTSDSAKLIDAGIEAYKKINTKNTEYNKKYEDVARKVKAALVARGFTTKLLYGNVEFTRENTGVMSHQRAMLGRPDCYFKDPKMSDGKLFHDLYINLSYSAGVSDKIIEENSYALYALCMELSKIISMRVYVINHVGTDKPTCYAYCLKKFRQSINPEEFLFFTSDSKRTFGWATYEILVPGHRDSTVGEPKGTVSIADFNLVKEIDSIWEKMITKSHAFRQAVGA